MPRSRARRAASSSSSDSDSDGEAQQIDEALYRQLGLAAALRRPADQHTACGELAAIVRQLYAQHCSKTVQATIVEDCGLAIDCCDGRLQSLTALAALMEGVERVLPQARRNALLRQYRQSSVQLRRRGRRRGGGAGGDAGSDSDDAGPPATFAHLPLEVMERVFRYLDPVSLARCACVVLEWRAAAQEDGLWRSHCAALLGGGPRRRSQQPQGQQQQAQQQQAQQQQQQDEGGWRQRFAAAARQRPERLLPWRTNRVLVGGRRLAWLPSEAQQQQQQRLGLRAVQYRHIDTAAVLTWLRSGGRRCGAGSGDSSSGGSSSEADSGGVEDDAAMSRRLRFWQL